VQALLKYSSCVLLIIAPYVAGCGGTFQQGARESEESNKEVVRRFVSAINDRQLDDLDEIVLPDVVRHSQATPGLDIRSLEAMKEFLSGDFVVVPDSHMELLQLVAEGDHVAYWATYSGTQQGQMGPFPPTGRAISSDFAGYFRLSDGKIAEIWVIWDNLTILTQLGHMPAAPGVEMFDTDPGSASPE
jgi:predicted ester cyclase